MSLLHLIDGYHFLIDKGFKLHSELPYCTYNGIEYYIGTKDDTAAVVAAMHDESLYLIDKNDLREMSATARTKGINKVTLFTNYGLEIHSRHETAQTVGFNKIVKPIS